MEWAIEDALMARMWREEIVAILAPWAGDRERALAWMREHVIPSFGATAEDLIEQGRGEAVLRHLQRISDGGYA